MNRYCNGVAYYVGTVCHSDFYDSFASNLMTQTGVPKLKGLPKGVEVTTRTNGRDEYICFFNNSAEPKTIPLPKPMFSMITSRGREKLELEPFEMDIVRK
jgi:beta-galactosidase